MGNVLVRRLKGLNWSLQSWTGVLLVIILLVHFYVLHFVTRGAQVTFATVAARLDAPIWRAIDIVFVFLAVYHGLNGLRMVVLDVGFMERYEKPITWGLVIVGVILGLMARQRAHCP